MFRVLIDIVKSGARIAVKRTESQRKSDLRHVPSPIE